METLNIDPIYLVTALVGFLLRWLFFLDNRKKRYLKESKNFSFTGELKNELFLVIASLLSTVGFLYGVPEALESLNKSNYWNPVVAIGCGMTSMDITRFIFSNLPSILNLIKDKFTKKIVGNSSEQNPES